MPALAVWAFLADRPRQRVWVWTLFCLFTLSLLTTKQHYAIDVGGGALTAAVGLKVASLFLPNALGQGQYVRPPQPDLPGATRDQPACVLESLRDRDR